MKKEREPELKSEKISLIILEKSFQLYCRLYECMGNDMKNVSHAALSCLNILNPDKNSTIFHYLAKTAYNEEWEVVNYLALRLLKNDPNAIHRKDGKGATPLYYAAFGGSSSPDFIRLLLNNGANVNHNINGYTPLHFLIYNFHNINWVSANILIDSGAKLDNHILGYAVAGCVMELQQCVLKEENKLMGRTALHLLFMKESIYPKKIMCNVVSFLVKEKHDINAVDALGNKPLYYVYNNQLGNELVELMLSKGATNYGLNARGYIPISALSFLILKEKQIKLEDWFTEKELNLVDNLNHRFRIVKTRLLDTMEKFNSAEPAYKMQAGLAFLWACRLVFPLILRMQNDAEEHVQQSTTLIASSGEEQERN